MLNELIINGFLLPGAIVALILFLAARTGHEWLQSVAIAAGLVAASVGLGGWPELRPTDSLGWMPHLALAAVPVALITSFYRATAQSWAQSWALRLAFVGVGVGLLAEPMRAHTWERWE